MLKDPRIRNTSLDPVMVVFSRGLPPKRLGEGLYEINHFNFEHVIDKPQRYKTYPACYPDFKDELASYGVCDSPEQFVAKFGEVLGPDPRTFTVAFTHVTKNPENKGQRGGWRWHKWGQYVGLGEPTCEYLDDEDGFPDGVYTFSIQQIDGPILKKNWDTGELEETK